MRREPEVPAEKSPRGRMSRWPCKDYLKGTCNNSFCEKWHPPECLTRPRAVADLGKSARMHIVKLVPMARTTAKHVMCSLHHLSCSTLSGLEQDESIMMCVVKPVSGFAFLIVTTGVVCTARWPSVLQLRGRYCWPRSSWPCCFSRPSGCRKL